MKRPVAGSVRTFAVLLVLIASLVLRPGFDQQAHAQPKGESLRLGSWNIKLLGEPSSKQKAEDLAKYIDFAKVDILALQEIKPTGPAPMGFAAPFETSKIVTEVCGKLDGLQKGTWKHILFPAFFVKDGKKQWTGIMWNEKKVRPIGIPERIHVSNAEFDTNGTKENLWKRNLHAMKFAAIGEKKTDFVLMVVHMKSNSGDGNFRPHREAEAKELVNKLPDVDKAFPKEKDLIVLGDTNFLRDKKKDKETARDVFVNAGFKDLNADNVGTFEGKAPFDRFLIPTDQKEFEDSTQRVLRDFLDKEGIDMKEFERRFSDHLMIVTEIRVMDDDDD